MFSGRQEEALEKIDKEGEIKFNDHTIHRTVLRSLEKRNEIELVWVRKNKQ